MMEYVICTSEHPEGLADVVRDWIGRGYVPHGSVVVKPAGKWDHDRIVYAQPMVKPEPYTSAKKPAGDSATRVRRAVLAALRGAGAFLRGTPLSEAANGAGYRARTLEGDEFEGGYQFMETSDTIRELLQDAARWRKIAPRLTVCPDGDRYGSTFVTSNARGLATCATDAAEWVDAL